MSLTCSRCSRANPAEAVYCYFDGHVLSGAARNGGPVTVGSQPFPAPFVFLSGKSCRTFDELAIACQEGWEEAKDALQQGYLQGFFGGLGRIDLAEAAKEAARFPDRDRGLDQLLAKLPTNVLEAPKLRVEPLEVSLGVIPFGEDRLFSLALENRGMRLLYGSVSSDNCPWLTLGDGAAAEKLFQFGGEASIPVHLQGKRLRAGNKPLEGKLVVESNGGTETVVVRVEVPVKPFPTGCLAGAKAPRQIAEKAKGNPKEAAVLFEQGAVAKWYEDNGWTYPVQGPSASGLGAVQQFFEALGLTPPPKVQINQSTLSFTGNVGDTLKATLEVSTSEKRPVYAHGASDQTWVEVRRASLNGRTATIPLVVNVPNLPGKTATAKVTVTSNGNQKFVVPITVAVAGAAFDFGDATATQAPPIGENAFSFDDAEPVAAAPPVTEKPPADPTFEPPPAPAKKAPDKAASKTPIQTTPGAGLSVKHVAPAALLVVALLGIVGLDLLLPSRQAGGTLDKGSGLMLVEPIFGRRRDGGITGRFGLRMPGELDPDPARAGKYKRLTFAEDGGTNNTCIRLDEAEHLFGLPPGVWPNRRSLIKTANRDRWTSTMKYPENVVVTQTVEIVPNPQTGARDTCLVRYTIENQDAKPHKVGLRVLLDTLIGTSDGVPFRVPGQSEFLTGAKTFGQKEVPDYLQAWERPDLKDPGTIAHLGLKNIDAGTLELEPLEKVIVCRHPNNSEIRWTVEPKPIDGKDSCVVLYWAEQPMNPMEKRELAFTYGLNTISGEGDGTIGLTAGGSFRPGGIFTLTATIKKPEAGQVVRLRPLTSGVVLADMESEEQVIDQAADQAQVSWRIRAKELGDQALEVSTGVVKEIYKVKILDKSVLE